ncbi:hypothetical protein NX021_27025 [Cytobacillus firmus]|nr:hypothetical protein [Cytobacillus firmus]
MISVEHDIDNEERFRFNVPFNCIEWIPGTSNEVLPDLDWEEESIVWLDYDDSFNKDMIQDIKTLSANLISGSMLIISCNVHYKHGERINSMKRNLEDKMPEHLREEDLDGWNVAKETRNIILAEIKDTLLERNALNEDLEKIEFKQLFNFCYKDGAKMHVWGVIL